MELGLRSSVEVGRLRDRHFRPIRRLRYGVDAPHSQHEPQLSAEARHLSASVCKTSQKFYVEECILFVSWRTHHTRTYVFTDGLK